MRRVLSFIALLAVALGLAIAPAQASNAYVFIGCKMTNPVILWKDATSSTAYRAVAVNAMNAWGTLTHVGFSVVTSGSNLTVASGNFGPTGFDGIMKSGTSLYPPGCSSTGNWTSTAFAWLNTQYTDAYTAQKRQSVFSHEIGHALGLDHENDGGCNTMAVMYYTTSGRYDSCSIYGPKLDDITGVNLLYP
jgi:Matrixin.